MRIHENDFIFNHIHKNLNIEYDLAIQEYINVGLQSADKLLNIAKDLHINTSTSNILDFASGYGCVARHFFDKTKSENFYCVDIHDEAISFLKDEIKVKAIKSSPIPEQFDLEARFDFIFVLSFFSHMPKSTFERWLVKLASLLTNKGFLLFTTHGMVSVDIIGSVDLDESGFWFAPNSEQLDLNFNEYGTTVSSFSFIYNLLEKNNMQLVYYKQGDWWGHQDTYIVKI
jgi:SAM-dependent methyltransferase